jgi:hypothetical protein
VQHDRWSHPLHAYEKLVPIPVCAEYRISVVSVSGLFLISEICIESAQVLIYPVSIYFSVIHILMVYSTFSGLGFRKSVSTRKNSVVKSRSFEIFLYIEEEARNNVACICIEVLNAYLGIYLLKSILHLRNSFVKNRKSERFLEQRLCSV